VVIKKMGNANLEEWRFVEERLLKGIVTKQGELTPMFKGSVHSFYRKVDPARL
jgi:hypothetical protein